MYDNEIMDHALVALKGIIVARKPRTNFRSVARYIQTSVLIAFFSLLSNSSLLNSTVYLVKIMQIFEIVKIRKITFKSCLSLIEFAKP